MESCRSNQGYHTQNPSQRSKILPTHIPTRNHSKLFEKIFKRFKLSIDENQVISDHQFGFRQ